MLCASFFFVGFFSSVLSAFSFVFCFVFFGFLFLFLYLLGFFFMFVCEGLCACPEKKLLEAFSQFINSYFSNTSLPMCFKGLVRLGKRDWNK